MVQTRPSKIKAAHMRRIMELAQPGDIILHYVPEYATSYFIPGKYSHGGVVVSSQTAIHAVSEGVVFIDLIDFMTGCDAVMLLRPNYVDSLRREWAVAFAKDSLGAPYDFIFDDSNPSRYFCFELCADVMRAGGVRIEKSGNILVAQDLIDTTKKVCEAP